MGAALTSIASEGDDVEEANVASAGAVPTEGSASSSRVDGHESSVDDADELFFPSVALPMAPEPWAEASASSSSGACRWATAREGGLLRRGPGSFSSSSGSRSSGFAFASRDPVITHLNSAISQLSRVLIELGGEAIPIGDDTKRMQRAERRVQRRLNGGEGSHGGVRAIVAASSESAPEASRFLSDDGYFAPVQPAIETQAWSRVEDGENACTESKP